MTDLLLRAADPAADLVADPHGPEAQALLARIVAEPRTLRHPRPPMHRMVRLGFAAAAAGAAAAVALVVPWPGGHAGLTSSAYAVTRQTDGSYRIVVHWAQLRNPARLQAALDRVGAPVRVLTGTELPATDKPGPVPACAKPTYGHPYSAQAVQWDFPDAASEVNGFVVRPAAFPRGGTLIVEVFYAPDGKTPAGTLSYMAIGRVPTCAQPMYAS